MVKHEHVGTSCSACHGSSPASFRGNAAAAQTRKWAKLRLHNGQKQNSKCNRGVCCKTLVHSFTCGRAPSSLGQSQPLRRLRPKARREKPLRQSHSSVAFTRSVGRYRWRLGFHKSWIMKKNKLLHKNLHQSLTIPDLLLHPQLKPSACRWEIWVFYECHPTVHPESEIPPSSEQPSCCGVENYRYHKLPTNQRADSIRQSSSPPSIARTDHYIFMQH